MASKKSGACGGLLHDKVRVQRRLVDALGAVSGLKGYRQLLSDIQGLDSEKKASCPDLGRAVADRAFDVEAGGRVLIKHALDSINDLRDTGELYMLMENAAQELSDLDGKDLVKRLEKEGKRARESMGDAAGDMFVEAVNALKDQELGFSLKNGNLVVRRRIGEGQSDKVTIAVTRQPGQMGRVSSDAFFGGRNGRDFVTPNRTFLPADCHHLPALVNRKYEIPVDIYEGTVSGLGMTKSLLYQHARRVSEIGPRGLRGEDPVTAILIAIAVIGAGLVVYGIATGDGFVAAFGAILIVGAALVAFGGYALILAVVA